MLSVALRLLTATLFWVNFTEGNRLSLDFKDRLQKLEGFYQTLLTRQVCDNVHALRGALIPFYGEMLKSVDRKQSRFVSAMWQVMVLAQIGERWLDDWKVLAATRFNSVEQIWNVVYDTPAMFTLGFWKFLKAMRHQRSMLVKKVFLKCKLV